MNGVLIIDKPAGLTSHDVVNRARRILQERSIGHLGTLDPMATGVLPLVTGTLTRLAQFYTAAEKSYEGTVRFGFATNTYDAEGEPTTTPQTVNLRAEEVEAVAGRFRGVFEQTPPPFSAKKIHGVPAYKLARQQKDVVLKPVLVEIKEFVILGGSRSRWLSRSRRLRNLHAFGCARNGQGTGLRRASGVAAANLGGGVQSRRRAHVGRSRRRSRCRRFTPSRRSFHPSAQVAATVSFRHRRRTDGRPHPQRTHRQSF